MLLKALVSKNLVSLVCLGDIVMPVHNGILEPMFFVSVSKRRYRFIPVPISAVKFYSLKLTHNHWVRTRDLHR